jgi:hypothetical protein
MDHMWNLLVTGRCGLIGSWKRNNDEEGITMTSSINGSINYGTTLNEMKQKYIRPLKDDDYLMAGIRVGINTADTYVALNNLVPTPVSPGFPATSNQMFGVLGGLTQAGFGLIKCTMNVNREYQMSMKVSGVGDIITGAGLCSQVSFGAAALPVTLLGIGITTAAKMYEILTINRRF